MTKKHRQEALAQEAREKVRKPLTDEAVGLLIGNSVEEQSWLMSVVRAVERAHGIGVENEPDQRST